MRRNIFWIVTITLFVMATASHAQTPKAKPSPKETTKSTTPEWPECCWGGKATDAVAPAEPEQLATTQAVAETTGGAATGASSGAGFSTSGSEETEAESSEEAVEKGSDLKRKLIGAAIKVLATKLKNKNGESSETAATNNSGYIGETEKNVTTDPVNSVQAVNPSNNATRRQRIQALREKMGNATTTTTNVTTDPLDSVQEVKRTSTTRRGTPPRQVSGDTSNAAPTDTPVNRVRPLRHPANANTPATITQPPSTQGGNASARPLNHPKLAAIRAAHQNRQNDAPPRKSPRARPKR